jgi:hypothetical protein
MRAGHKKRLANHTIGLILVAVVVASPGGLLGLARRARRRRA